MMSVLCVVAMCAASLCLFYSFRHSPILLSPVFARSYSFSLPFSYLCDLLSSHCYTHLTFITFTLLVAKPEYTTLNFKTSSFLLFAAALCFLFSFFLFKDSNDKRAPTGKKKVHRKTANRRCLFYNLFSLFYFSFFFWLFVLLATVWYREPVCLLYFISFFLIPSFPLCAAASDDVRPPSIVDWRRNALHLRYRPPLTFASFPPFFWCADSS